MEIRNLAPSSVTGQTSKTKTRHENVTTIPRIALIGHRREELPSQRVEGGKKNGTKSSSSSSYVLPKRERGPVKVSFSNSKPTHGSRAQHTLSKKIQKNFPANFNQTFTAGRALWPLIFLLLRSRGFILSSSPGPATNPFCPVIDG